jgi:hypothetical protein
VSYENTEMGSLTAVGMGSNGGGNGMLGGGATAAVIAAGMGAIVAVMTSPRSVRKKVAIWGGLGGLATYYAAGPILGSFGALEAVRPFVPLAAGWGVSKLQEADKLPAVGPAS